MGCEDPSRCEAPCSGRSELSGAAVIRSIACDACGFKRLVTGLSELQPPILGIQPPLGPDASEGPADPPQPAS
jgi:hypothetical protein